MEDSRNNQKLYLEADIVFTDGKRLFFIECKAGKVEANHIHKAKNLAGTLGGAEAIPIIVAGTSVKFKIDETIPSRAEDNRVKLLKFDDLTNLTESIKKIINPTTP
jgi:predicted RecB family endonuclease